MIKTLWLLLIALMLTNCSTKNLSPANVTDYFWSAQREQKTEDAKKFVLTEDQENLTLQENIKIRHFTLGEVHENGTTATVPTKMFLEGFLSKDTKDEIEIDFETTLNQTDDGWKVDFAKTKQALYLETAKKFGTTLGSGIFSKLKESLGELKGVQNILEEMLQGLKKSLEKE